MDIEEQELHYTPEAPLHGWRLFRVRACGGGLVLSSPMYHDPEPPSWPEVASEARCYEDHPAPAAGCRGVRAERAEIVRIALPESAWPRGGSSSSAMASLSAESKTSLPG